MNNNSVNVAISDIDVRFLDEPSLITENNYKNEWWRQMVCRHGFYPLLLAPFFTVASILDIYSSIGCEYVRLDVGFQPLNEAWNQTTADLGIFNMINSDGDVGDGLNNDLHCNSYDHIFNEHFISGDKTWSVARIMAYLSASTGLLAMVLIWLITFVPIPVRLIWPIVIIPCTLIAFLAGVSKFLFIDTAVCSTNIWFESDGIPRQANSCSLGVHAYCNMLSCALYLLNVLLVCVKTPEKRDIEYDFLENKKVGRSGSSRECDWDLENMRTRPHKQHKNAVFIEQDVLHANTNQVMDTQSLAEFCDTAETLSKEDDENTDRNKTRIIFKGYRAAPLKSSSIQHGNKKNT